MRLAHPSLEIRLIDERVRAIVLASPNNPTGSIYPPEIIARFHELCLKKKITLVLDETYRDFIDPDKGRPHAVLAEGDWRDSFIQLYSFSKSYCIPGHRIGAMLASKAAIAQTKKIMDSLQICTNRTPQMVMAWAIDALSDWRAANRDEVLGKLSVFREAMAGVNDWSVDSSGAYFAYVRPPLSQISDRDIARGLAEECGVLSLPGSFFGKSQESHLRLAFANVSEDAIRELAPRLVSWSNRKA